MSDCSNRFCSCKLPATVSPSISYGMVERHTIVCEYGGDCWCLECHSGNPRQPLAPGPRVPTTKGEPPYPLFTSSGNEEIDQAARDRRAANQRYFHVAGLSWWPLLTAAALGIIFLLTPYWAVTVLLFFGAALWAFAWVPTMTRRKRWMESRGRYYGAVKHIAELETWHEQNP